MKIPYYQVDAFASRLFGGNPAGVCLLDAWLPDATMQTIAFENGLAETAFLVPEGDGYGLRWFTPAVEVDLCGHATLAAAHVLGEHRGVTATPIIFHTQSGRMTVEREGSRWVLDFPSRPAEPAPGSLEVGLGAVPAELYLARDYLAVFENEATVRALRPDLNAVAALDVPGIIVTAPGDHCDFVSRYFAPRVGIPEDPATGSSHCTLIPYWAGRTGRKVLKARQVSARGGEIHCKLTGDRVRIGGEAVTYLAGTINLPPAPPPSPADAISSGSLRWETTGKA